MTHVYNELLMKQKRAEILAMQGKKQFEYDSDEDVEVSTFKKIKLKIPKKLLSNF